MQVEKIRPICLVHLRVRILTELECPFPACRFQSFLSLSGLASFGNGGGGGGELLGFLDGGVGLLTWISPLIPH